jgi:hypothetical protein
MFGEFISDMIQNSGTNFYNKLTSTKSSHNNRVLYPNYLSPIDKDMKIHTDEDFTLADYELKILEDTYSNSNVCVPTHWFYSLKNTNLPCEGIRLYSNNVKYINLAYCMAWIKSHVNSGMKEHRKKELDMFVQSGHKYAELIKSELSKGNFKNWKYLAIKYNMLKDGNLDMDYYFRQRAIQNIRTTVNQQHRLPEWNYIDAGEMIHGNMSNVRDLEILIQGNLDKDYIAAYAQKNIELLKNTTGLTIDDLNGFKWIDSLIDYCKLVELSST